MRQRRLARFLDNALETSQLLIDSYRKMRLAFSRHASLEEAAEGELHQWQHVRSVGFAQDARIEAHARGGVSLVDDTGGGGRLAHDLRQLDRSRRRQIIG